MLTYVVQVRTECYITGQKIFSDSPHAMDLLSPTLHMCVCVCVCGHVHTCETPT